MRSRSSRSSRSSIASHRIASHRIASHSIASLRIASIRIASHRIAKLRIAVRRIASLRIPSIRIASHRLTSLRIASLAATAALSHYFVYGKSKHDSSRHMRHIVPQLQRFNLALQSGARSASMPLLTCLPPTYILVCKSVRQNMSWFLLHHVASCCMS